MVLSSLCGNVILSWSLLSGIKGHVNMLDTSTARGKNRVNDNYEDNGNDGMLLLMTVLSTNNYNEDHDCE